MNAVRVDTKIHATQPDQHEMNKHTLIQDNIMKRPLNLRDPQDSNSPYITQENLVVRGLLTVGNKKKNGMTTAQI